MPSHYTVLGTWWPSLDPTLPPESEPDTADVYTGGSPTVKPFQRGHMALFQWAGKSMFFTVAGTYSFNAPPDSETLPYAPFSIDFGSLGNTLTADMTFTDPDRTSMMSFDSLATALTSGLSDTAGLDRRFKLTFSHTYPLTGSFNLWTTPPEDHRQGTRDNFTVTVEGFIGCVGSTAGDYGDVVPHLVNAPGDSTFPFTTPLFIVVTLEWDVTVDYDDYPDGPGGDPVPVTATTRAQLVLGQTPYLAGLNWSAMTAYTDYEAVGSASFTGGVPPTELLLAPEGDTPWGVSMDIIRPTPDADETFAGFAITGAGTAWLSNPGPIE